MARIIRMMMTLIILGVFSLPGNLPGVQAFQGQLMDDKPPEAIQGGEWSDDFMQGKIQEMENMDIQMGHLFLKYTEQLHWIQTWTAHFATGEFYHTEAISDSVRLAWDEANQNFYTAGVYTSTVFYAGKPVDWAYSDWFYSGNPDGVIIEFRTGDTPTADESWTGWMTPLRGNFEFICSFTFNLEMTDCFNNMLGINSSPFIQYRATFVSDNPSQTIEFYDFDLLFGIHCASGKVLSVPIPPVDLREWESVMITSTVPAGTSLVIDVMDTAGTILIHDVKNGTSLEGIDTNSYPAIQLGATFSTTDESISPDVDIWGVRWLVWHRSYLPVTVR